MVVLQAPWPAGEKVSSYLAAPNCMSPHALKANSNSNKRVIYADTPLKRWENLSHSFHGITQINDGMWLGLGWSSCPQVGLSFLWWLKSLAGKGRSKQGIITEQFLTQNARRSRPHPEAHGHDACLISWLNPLRGIISVPRTHFFRVYPYVRRNGKRLSMW